jgi:hypothetical protein
VAPVGARQGGPGPSVAEQDRGGVGRGGAVRGQEWPEQQREEDLRRRRWRAWKLCKIEKREKERTDPSTIPDYVRRTDTSADEHKWADLRGGSGALCSSTT